MYVYLFRFDSVLICIFKVVLHETPEAKIQQTNASQQPVGCRILSLTLEIRRVSKSLTKYFVAFLYSARRC